MGVPALFRWLSRKYPKIISPVVEEDVDEEIGGAKYSDPNPNGETDNLYLDMNGIVHPCSHPEHKPAPATEDEMFLDIFTYTDRVLMMARPRKVLMIAVDGVAPRAKMNQQRARRFRAAQEAKIKQEEKERDIRERELRGEIIDTAIKEKRAWDSNAITPGTPFMGRLAEALRYWVAYKLSSDPGWADLQVIISDATVPGEGEHKLMSFIRSQRSDPSYNPNTKHCIYGLDADLIFLGLATHEPHFRVLREDVFANQDRQMRVSDQLSITAEQQAAITERDKKKPFLWLHVNVLREYLTVELFNPHLPFQYDFERAIDDWVFMCFFVGNDFLPHLPSLDVRDNGIDILVGCWKRLLPKLNDFLTCDGNLNLEGVEKLMGALAYKEDEIFRKRREMEVRREEGRKRRKFVQEEEKALKSIYMNQVSKGSDKAPVTADVNMPLMTTSGENVDGYAQLSNKDIVHNRGIITKANMSNADAAAALKKLIDSKKNAGSLSAVEAVREAEQSVTNSETPSEEPSDDSRSDKKRTADDLDNATSTTGDADEESEDNGDVKLWEPGYRNRYYETKFGATSAEEIDRIRRDVVRSYLEGVSWCVLYYFQGCPSWQWYFPYHYAPFAADFTDLVDIVGEEGFKFDQGEPFRPYEQLMSVLPAASGHNLPEVFRPLMSSPDSEIIDFYPEDFKIDMNGAKMSWQGIALLPFIDETRLLKAVRGVYPQLTDAEVDRNTNKSEVLFISPKNSNYKRFHEVLYYDDSQDKVVFKFAKSSLAGIARKIELFNPDGKTFFPLLEGDMPNVQNRDFFQVYYSMPPKKHGKSMLLNGYIPHVSALTEEDKNNIMYGSYQRNYGGRFNAPPDNGEYINKGPSGKDVSLMYSLRRGGYRSYLEYMNGGNQEHDRQVQAQSQFNSNYRSGFGNDRFNGNNQYGNQYNRYGNQNGNQYGSNHYGNQYDNSQYGSQNHYRNQNQYGNQTHYGNNQYGRNQYSQGNQYQSDQYGNNQYGNQNQHGSQSQYGNNQYNNNGRNYNNYDNRRQSGQSGQSYSRQGSQSRGGFNNSGRNGYRR
ncbi:hypothetical protein G9P44_002066 [Scheffersomyces stipitis]|nr:hypothetical protein G9P44_002066 [Scheffersomyces stipitis]